MVFPSSGESNRPTAIDLFSGAGGLTLGLKRAGFAVLAGVEVYPKIVETYQANHPEVKVIKKDVRKVTGKEILEECEVSSVDLVAGCPPCQGFSKLTDKYHKDDPRNELISEMARVVLEISPRAVMMENVPGLATRGKDKLDEFISKLGKAGYQETYSVLKLANYGVPQSRRRLLYLAGKGFKIDLPPETHSRKGDKKKNLKKWLSLADVIRGLDKPVTLSKALRLGGPRKVNWNVVRDLKAISKDRMKALGTGGSRKSLPNRLRPECHKDTYRGFENVYGRMAWKQLPSTVTTGFASPSTGRFGHPSQIRTISVREAALLQTFPPDYKFETDFVELATNLVGNALPPRFAELAGRRCMRALEETSKKGESRELGVGNTAERTASREGVVERGTTLDRFF